MVLVFIKVSDGQVGPGGAHDFVGTVSSIDPKDVRKLLIDWLGNDFRMQQQGRHETLYLSAISNEGVRYGATLWAFNDRIEHLSSTELEDIGDLSGPY
jgi:hypothetical protein